MTEDNHEKAERRKFPRAEIELPVRFYERGKSRPLTQGRSVNIGPGGILASCLEIDVFSQGELLDVELRAPTETEPSKSARFRARVQRLHRGESTLCAVEVVGEPPPCLLAPDLVGRHPRMQEVKRRLLAIADRDLNVLIQGETGTGKNVLAELIHRYSSRASQTFVRVNCPSIPASLFESELFGHEKGAFTDARTARPGLFRLASEGTLLLDEISAVPPSTQAKLLQAIEQKRFMPVGSSQEVEVHTRIIAITNEDLRRLMREGDFRQDLYHRLNEAPIYLPPLRDRKRDIPLLVDYFLRRYCAEFGKQYEPLRSETMKLLQSYSWPGNVRELSNCIKYGVLTGSIQPPEEGAEVPSSPQTPAAEESARPSEPVVESLREARERATERAERRAVVRALEATAYNKSEAADRLGVSYRTLLRKVRRYGIDA